MPWLPRHYEKSHWVPGHFEGLRWVKGHREKGHWVKGHWNPKEEPMLTFLLAIVLLVLIAGVVG
jgi:hypothetical protein